MEEEEQEEGRCFSEAEAGGLRFVELCRCDGELTASKVTRLTDLKYLLASHASKDPIV